MTTGTGHNSKNKISSGDITKVQSKEGALGVSVGVSDDEAFKTNLSNSSHLLADMNASPLHLHVTTVEGALLQGKPLVSVPSSIISRSSRSRSNSRTRARSRSRDAGRLDGSQSPSVVSISGYGSASASASSSRRNSCSSIEDIEPDILTDKMGHEELTLPPGSCASSVSTLHTVNERMSEDALEDCHAFTDLKDVIRQIQATHSGSGDGQSQSQWPLGIGTGTSSRNSVNGGSIMEDPGHLLETLEEFEEGEEDDEIEEDDNQDQPQPPQAQPQDDDKNQVTAKKEEDKQKLLLLKKKKSGVVSD